VWQRTIRQSAMPSICCAALAHPDGTKPWRSTIRGIGQALPAYRSWNSCHARTAIAAQRLLELLADMSQHHHVEPPRVYRRVKHSKDTGYEETTLHPVIFC